MNDEFKSSIFDIFAQAKNTVNSRHNGTGLGTAITKQLVNLMGGEIGFTSIINKGNYFWFRLKFNNQDTFSEIQQALYSINSIHVLLIDHPIKPATKIRTYLDSLKITYNCIDKSQDALKKLRTYTMWLL